MVQTNRTAVGLDERKTRSLASVETYLRGLSWWRRVARCASSRGRICKDVRGRCEMNMNPGRANGVGRHSRQRSEMLTAEEREEALVLVGRPLLPRHCDIVRLPGLLIPRRHPGRVPRRRRRRHHRHRLLALLHAHSQTNTEMDRTNAQHAEHARSYVRTYHSTYELAEPCL